MPRSGLLFTLPRPLGIASVALASMLFAACGDRAPTEPVVTVYHRCGDTNFDALEGWFGRLEGDTGVNSRWRVRFDREGEAVTLKWVGGNAERYLLDGARTGNETMTFDEVGGPLDRGGAARRIKASLTSDCRLQLDHFDVKGGREEAREAADGLNLFVPYPELQRLDFEPCTEPLYLRGAAKSASKATGGSMRPAVPTSVKEDTLPVGAFSPSSQIGPGCRPVIDLFVNGEAEMADMVLDKASGGTQSWRVDYEIGFIGEQHLALHRKLACGEETTLLGVACTVIEVIQ